MRSLRPGEVRASVMCRSHDHVMRGQRVERIFENRTRQVRAVGVEGNHASSMGVALMLLSLIIFSSRIFALIIWREVRNHRSEGCGKTFTFLRNHACFLAGQLRQLVDVR